VRRTDLPSGTGGGGEKKNGEPLEIMARTQAKSRHSGAAGVGVVVDGSDGVRPVVRRWSLRMGDDGVGVRGVSGFVIF
jgi:hypothetical protein